MRNHKLNKDGTTEPIEDVIEWARWFETADRQISDTLLGNTRISTVFLGVEHYEGMLFETMVFSDNTDIDEFTERYRTQDEAKAGHAIVEAMVRKHLAIVR